MKIEIDLENRTLECSSPAGIEKFDLYSRDAFERLSDVWVKVGWSERYAYTFSWLGRPIIQLPEDMVRTQEVVYRIRPDVIVETGVAHGGSLVYYASLCKVLGRGRVVGVDIEIRPHNRSALEAHDLTALITLIEGDSTNKEVVEQVRRCVRPGDAVMVILDSCHTAEHVAAELEAYHSLITPGSYIVATDGVMRSLFDVPGGNPSWAHDNPCTAAEAFASSHPEFVLEQPDWPFNESRLRSNVTHWPAAWLRRL